MKSTYARAMRGIRLSEGGYSNHPRDPGGATNFGIIQTVYDAYRKSKGVAKHSVRLITEAEVNDIYKTRYADKIRYDDLPAGIDYATLDGAVNSGVSRGAKWLQGALGISADGKVGNETISAAAKADAVKMVKSMCAKRMSFLRGLSIFSTFGRGCLVMNPVKLLKAVDGHEGVRHRTVHYEEIVRLPELKPAVDDLPFIKRYPYEPESEYRIVYEDAGRKAEFKNFALHPGTIEAVILSPWMPTALVNSVRGLLKKIDGASKIPMYASTLISNQAWQKVADRAE